MDVLNACEYNNDVVCVEEGIFRNWEKLKDKLFNRILYNTTK